MTPRNTQQGASASARTATVSRRAGAAPSVRTTSSRKPARTRESSPARPARPKRDASWFRWWLLPIFVVCAAALFIAAYYPVARVQYSVTRQRAQLQAELASLDARNAKLQGIVSRLKTDEGVEDYARSQLGLVKAGEHVVVVTDGTKPAVLPTATVGGPPVIESSTETTVAPRGPWTAFLDSVFNVQ